MEDGLGVAKSLVWVGSTVEDAFNIYFNIGFD